MIWTALRLMKALHYWIGFKKAIEKIRRRTFWKQPLDNKLFLRCCTLKSIFIAHNASIYITHVAYLLFMLPLRMIVHHMCSALLSFSLVWVDLRSQHHLWWSPLWQRQQLGVIAFARKNSILYTNFYLLFDSPKANFESISRGQPY